MSYGGGTTGDVRVETYSTVPSYDDVTAAAAAIASTSNQTIEKAEFDLNIFPLNETLIDEF